MNIFDPGNGQKYKEMMNVARQVNAERDQADRESGATAPGDETEAAFLRNAISAIVAGIETHGWDSVCEGLDMLQQAELRLRQRTASKRRS